MILPTFLQLNFASGARVKIDCRVSAKRGERNGHIGVFIQAPSDDFGSTEGLCGTWTSSKMDDFTGPSGQLYHNEGTFSHSWRYNFIYGVNKWGSNTTFIHKNI